MRARVTALVVAFVFTSFFTSPATQAATRIFDLSGTAGPGLLAGNETSAVTGTPGSGGEDGAGIFYDDVTNLLTVNVAWGSANGFTNLTGDANAAHIHGPTASPAPAGFSQAAIPIINLHTLGGFNSSASAGGIHDSVTLTALQETELLANRYYINVHTATNGGGEIRGHLVEVPEPTSAALLLLTAAAATVRRRRSQ